jgi:hypothetical protein
MRKHSKDTKLNVLGMVPNLMLGMVGQQSLPQGKQFQRMKQRKKIVTFYSESINED